MKILAEVKKQNVEIIKGSDALVRALIENGVEAVFGYPGTPILSVYDSLSKSDKIRQFISRHEQGAVHSAEGYARVSGNCGVVLVTSGPGFTNTITGISNATSDGTPLVVITALSENIGKNEFQDIDVASIAKNCSKKIFIISKPEDISKTISQAIHEAEALPKGAVVVGITKSILESESLQKTYKKRHEIKVEAPHSCILKAIDLLKNANRPLIIVGGGCKDSEQDIKELLQLTNIPVCHTLMGKGIVDSVSAGMIGANGNSELNNIIKDSDVVLALGTRFTDRTTNYEKEFLPSTKIINVNIESNKSQNIKVDKEIIGEVKIVLQHIIGVIKSKKILFDIKYEWISGVNKKSKINYFDDRELSMQNVVRTLYSHAKIYNPIIATDIGEHQIEVVKQFKAGTGKDFLTSGGLGSMGFGLPAAIGAYIAKPNALILNITGDGSFQMNMQELGTCAQYNIPVKIFIINNSSLGMIKTQQGINGYAQNGSNLLNPDFAKIAQSYGIAGYRITSMTDLETKMNEIFQYKKPILLDIILK